MTNITEEDIRAFHDGINNFFTRLNDEKKQLQEDLILVKTPISGGKVCDFGCGCGFTTLCLMSILDAFEAIGIDNDPTAINQANLWYKAVKEFFQLLAEEEVSDDEIIKKANRILGIKKPPEFRVGDVVSGLNLPSDVSLAYCRRLLVNIVHGSYQDNISGEDRAKLAIEKIANTIMPGGWFIAVEEAEGGNFCRLLEEANLQRVNIVRFQSGDRVPHFRYVYRKPNASGV